MNKSVFFSIIIPTYNRANLIPFTIESILAQTFTNYEVIIVDDGSTDNTPSVVEQLENQDDRLKYFRKKNEERGAARNYGIQKAKGEFAVFFDSDDLMKPHYLELLYKNITEQPNINFIAAKFNFLRQDNSEYYYNNGLNSGWYNNKPFLLGNSLACNYAIRIKNNNFSFFLDDREYASIEDWLFLLTNLEKNKIYIVDEVAISMREHESRSMTNNQKVIKARQKAVVWALENLNLNPDEQSKLKAWSHYYCGIHFYLDNDRLKAVKETFKAIRHDNINTKFLILLFKSLVGRKVLSLLGVAKN